MPTLYLAHGIDSSVISKVADMVDHEMLYNPDWSGADIKIKRDHYTWLELHDETIGAHQLFAQVHNIINGE
jgi:hypothetical protein